MADAAQEFGLSRAWHTATHSFGEREAVLGLAFLLPLGALLIGFCRGTKSQARPRAMSFGSGYMSIGSWPKDVNMTDPIITAFLFLDGVPEQSALEEACRRMLQYHNFRALPQRKRWTFFPPSISTRFEWRDIEVIPADVITRTKVKGSAEVLAEMDIVKDATLRQQTFDGRDLPMWGLHVIENSGSEEAGLGTVVALRVHHTLGDGMSMVAVARSVLEAASGGPLEMGQDRRVGVEKALTAEANTTKRALSCFSVGKILKGVREVIALSTAGPDTPLPFGHLEGPFSGGGVPVAADDDSRESDSEKSKVVRKKKRKKRGAFSGKRRTVLLPDLSLPLLKKIKNASGGTVNDVILCLIAGCVRRYSEDKVEGVSFGGPGFKSRALIPVALPRKLDTGDASILCNKWAFVSIDMSVDEADPAARLERVKAITSGIKQSPTAALQYLMQAHVMPHFPVWVCREMVYGALATHTVTVSNVPGPQEAVTFARVGLRKIQFAFSNMMPNVGAVSLNGAVAINFVVDPVSVPESHTLPGYFLSELEALTVALGVEGSSEISAGRAEAAALVNLMDQAAAASQSS